MESGKMRDFEKSEYARKSEIKPAPRRLLMLYMINELNILWRLKNFKQPLLSFSLPKKSDEALRDPDSGS